jgi:hypothetical protein
MTSDRLHWSFENPIIVSKKARWNDSLPAFMQASLLAGIDFHRENAPKHCLGKMSDNKFECAVLKMSFPAAK